MSEKTTSDTLLPLPIDTKKALRVYAAEMGKSMGEAGSIIITNRMQEVGKLPQSAEPQEEAK
jgi:plasmid stability protein